MPKCRLFSIFSVKSLFILAVVVALNACDAGNAQVRAAGNTIKRPIQGEPRDAVSVQGRR